MPGQSSLITTSVAGHVKYWFKCGLISLFVCEQDIERVDAFKLLRIYVSGDLSWNNHVTCIYKRANSRLHFLRQLKRAAVSCRDMLRFYIAVICPVMEYAAPV